MPWNEPGGNNNRQGPWGGKQDQKPPDLDQLIMNFIRRLGQLLHLKKASSWPNTPNSSNSGTYGVIFGLLLVAILVVWLIAGLYIVNPAEEAVILRFGKYVDVQQPGLHWMVRLIDSKYLVDVQKIYSFSLQGDYLTKSSEQSDLPNPYVDMTRKAGSPISVDRSKNLVNVELSVQYRIADPKAYLFNSVNPDQTINEVSAGALSDVIGQMKLDEVLTTGREFLSAGVMERIKQVLTKYGTGLEVVAVTLRKVQAPDQVRMAFNDVNRADQDRSTYIQHAQAYASRVVPLAQGNAARILADANAYRQQSVLAAQAKIAKYEALVKVHQAFPEITSQRMYLEAMQNVLKNTSKILVDVNGSNNVLYLPIDQMLKANKISLKLSAANRGNTPTQANARSAE